MAAQYKVPFFKYSELFLANETAYMDTIRDVCSRGAFILQRDVEAFEADLAKFTGARHVYGVSNGTDALTLALMAAGLQPGDEVIVPSHTYVATAAAPKLLGAKVVLVECGEDHLVDPESIRKAITPRTRIVMPAHLNGRTCDMEAIGAIAREHKLTIVEDAAQAVGSRFKGQHAGTFGAAGTFSFYPSKILGAFGDAGAVVSNDDAVGERLKLLRDHGRDDNGEVVAWGHNCRLDNLHAAILHLKLKTLQRDLDRRREIAAQYTEALSPIEDLVLPPAPTDTGTHYDVYQNYEIESGRRDALQAYLKEQGVHTIVQWGGKAVHQLRNLGFDVKLPRTERLFERCMLLPMNTALSDEDVRYVCETVRRFYNGRA